MVPDSRPGDETVLVPPTRVPHASDSTDRGQDSARRQVALVEGSSPHLSQETRDVLRSRLRIAAVLFFVGLLRIPACAGRSIGTNGARPNIVGCFIRKRA